MSQKLSLSFRLLVILVIFSVTGCGGSGGKGSSVGLTTVPDLYLRSLLVEVGGQTLNFDPSRTGPYEMNVPLEADEVSITAVSKMDNARIFISELAIANINDIDFPSPSVNEEEVNSGELATRLINQGNNTYIISVWDAGKNYKIEYRVKVHRVSSEASLSSLAFIALRSENGAISGDDAVDSGLNFDPSTTEYSLDVDYPYCAIGVYASTSEPHSTLRINGKKYSNGQQALVALTGLGAENPNVITITVESEDQSVENRQLETYTINVERNSASASELQSEPTLSALQLADSIVWSGDFKCAQLDVKATVNRDVSASGLTLDTSVDGASILLSKYLLDESDAISIDEDGNSLYEFEDEIVTAREAYTLNYDLGVNRYEIQVSSENGEEAQVYELTVEKKENNWIFVEDTVSLQNAIKGAQPGDEIIIGEGEYMGSTGVVDDTSGHEFSHFYSSASGLLDDPIVLRGRLNDDVVLKGDGTTDNAVLRIEGDYWDVSGIEIRHSGDGVILDSASNDVLDTLTLTEIENSAVIIRNGSHNDTVKFSTISASKNGVVVGSEGVDWNSAPDSPGLFESSNTGIKIRNNDFGRNILAEHITINEGSENSVISGNVFDSELLSGTRVADSIVSLSGNDVEVSFNVFNNSLNNIPAQQILIDDAAAEWHPVTWGENISIFENSMEFPGEQQDFINNVSAVNVYVYNNTISGQDGIAITNSGLELDATDRTKTYQFQLVENNEFCLNILGYTLNGEEFGALGYFDCVETVNNTWQLRHGGEGAVLLQSMFPPETFILGPLLPGFIGNNAYFTLWDTAELAENSNVIQHRWVLENENNGVAIRSYWNRDHAITPISTLEEGVRAALHLDEGSDIQRFNLVEVVNE